MFSIFKRKKSSLEDHLRKVTNDTSFDFQLDVFRNGRVDFQVIRQTMLKAHGFKDIDPKGLAIILSFDREDLSNKIELKTFKNASVFKKAFRIEIEDLSYVFYAIKARNDLQLILNYVSQIQTEVYGYDDDTYYYFKYKEI